MQIRAVLFIVVALIAILRLFSSCSRFDSGAYIDRGHSIEADLEFKNYLKDNISDAAPLIDIGDGSISYFIQWADDSREWRDDLRGAWCVSIVGDIS